MQKDPEQEAIVKYNQIFIVLFSVFQPLCMIFTGFFVRGTPHDPSNPVDSSLVTAVGSFFLVLIGKLSLI